MWTRAAVGLLVVVACGPIDVPAGNVTDEAAGPPVVLTRSSPSARFTFTVAVSEEASTRGDPSFQVESEELGLGNVGEPALPVEVTIRPIEGGTPISLRRGWCRGDGCVGSFAIAFERAASAESEVSFGWAIAANVTFPSPEIPDGASVDVSIT